MVLAEEANGTRGVSRCRQDDETQSGSLNLGAFAAEQNIRKVVAGKRIDIPIGGIGRQIPVGLVQPKLTAGSGYDLFHSAHMVKMSVGQQNVKQQNGVIDLPLILNPDDRPRQIVSHTLGKKAITHYQVIKQYEGKTRIYFYPETGRTHQLRVHASHPDGLNTPIIGDTLYGTHSDRLYLHAQLITFTHPITKQETTISAPAPF